jgi:hypothetical protein
MLQRFAKLRTKGLVNRAERIESEELQGEWDHLAGVQHNEEERRVSGPSVQLE